MKLHPRNEAGFTLPTVLALGVVAGMWMLGTAALVVPSAGRITMDRARDVSRASAEAALDWAVQRLNDPQQRSSIDGKVNIAVPPTVLADGENFSATVTVTNAAPPTECYLYDSNIDPTQPASNISDGNGWRAVTATVTPRGSMGAARTVRVILKPTYALTPDITHVVETYEGDPVSLFAKAAFVKMDLGGLGSLTTNSYDSAVTPSPSSFQNQYADIGTNRSAILRGYSSIGGDLVVTAPKGTTSTVATGVDNARVHGKITANGDVSGFDTTSAENMYKFESRDPLTLPPVPAAPSDAVDLGTRLNVSGSSVVRLSATAARLPDGTVIPNTNGNYIVSSISMAENGRVMIDGSAGPVNVYVQGNGSSNGLRLTGNGVYNPGLPSHFRIWYGGTGDTRIQGSGVMRMLVYAPNSNVYQTSNGEIYGAVVANSMMVDGNAVFHYDVALNRMSEFMYRPLKERTVQTSTTSSNKVKTFQSVSWDEW
jgi:Tfp pilus assembly protein PilX